MNIIKSFSFKEDKEGIMNELEVIAARERKKTSELIVEVLEQYVKAHSSGNSTFTLDNWKDPEFQAVPAFLSDKEKWISHYKNSNEKDKTKLRIQAVNFNKWFRMVDINE